MFIFSAVFVVFVLCYQHLLVNNDFQNSSFVAVSANKQHCSYIIRICFRSL